MAGVVFRLLDGEVIGEDLGVLRRNKNDVAQSLDAGGKPTSYRNPPGM